MPMNTNKWARIESLVNVFSYAERKLTIQLDLKHTLKKKESFCQVITK